MSYNGYEGDVRCLYVMNGYFEANEWKEVGKSPRRPELRYIYVRVLQAEQAATLLRQ
jgi:hypothetical protein